jgi:hypothetical protein
MTLQPEPRTTDVNGAAMGRQAMTLANDMERFGRFGGVQFGVLPPVFQQGLEIDFVDVQVSVEIPAADLGRHREGLGYKSVATLHIIVEPAVNGVCHQVTMTLARRQIGVIQYAVGL